MARYALPSGVRALQASQSCIVMSLWSVAGQARRVAGTQAIPRNLFLRAMTTAADVEAKLRDKLKAQDVVRDSLQSSCAPGSHCQNMLHSCKHHDLMLCCWMCRR